MKHFIMCWLFLAANWVGFRTTMKTNVYVYACGVSWLSELKLGDEPEMRVEPFCQLESWVNIKRKAPCLKHLVLPSSKFWYNMTRCLLLLDLHFPFKLGYVARIVSKKKNVFSQMLIVFIRYLRNNWCN